jgi:spore maturation protein A
MSAIWLILTFTGLIALTFTDASAVLPTLTDGSGAAAKLCMTLVASYALWMGFFSLIDKLGITDALAKLLSPLTRFLFPFASNKARKFAAMNFSANILGLGNAATPMGVNTILLLDEGNGMTDDMATFVVISATSLQLVPTTMLSMRASAGSVHPTSVLIPCIAATVFSTVSGVIICKIIAYAKRKKREKSAFERTRIAQNASNRDNRDAKSIAKARR